MSRDDNYDFESLNRRLIKHLAFPVNPSDSGTAFEWKLNGSGLRTLELLSEIFEAIREESKKLYECRSLFKEVISRYLEDSSGRGARLAINNIIFRTKDDSVLMVAIWLCGRCAGKASLNSVAPHRFHQNWRVRTEVARTLKRIHGWTYLYEMETKDCDAGVRRIATQKRRGSFSGRLRILNNFSQPCNLQSAPRQFLFVDDSVEFSHRAPKSVELIRSILKRIKKILKPI